jgi:hypothetical protein
MTQVLPRIDYASHPAYGGMFEPHEGLGRRALRMLEPHIKEMQALEADRAAQFGYRYGAVDAVGAELAAHGAIRIQLPAKAVDHIHGGARPIIEDVQEHLRQAKSNGEPLKYKTALGPVDAQSHPDLWRSVDEAMREAGVYAITAAYFGSPSAKLRSLGVLVNHPDQDWANRLFRDLDVPAPPTAGFHIDSNGRCFIKAVLYLSDVGPEQGPFGIVEGSHRWDQGSQDRIFRRAFDRSELITRSAKKRRLFLSLPREMQVKAEFGGDMLADSPEAEALLSQEIVALGPRGQLNLFDPEGVHRGGNVRAGERHVLLITAMAQP